MMTLQEMIKHCEEKANDNNKCADEYRQLAEWLLELKERREMDEVHTKITTITVSI